MAQKMLDRRVLHYFTVSPRYNVSGKSMMAREVQNFWEGLRAAE